MDPTVDSALSLVAGVLFGIMLMSVLIDSNGIRTRMIAWLRSVFSAGGRR